LDAWGSSASRSLNAIFLRPVQFSYDTRDWVRDADALAGFSSTVRPGCRIIFCTWESNSGTRMRWPVSPARFDPGAEYIYLLNGRDLGKKMPRFYPPTRTIQSPSKCPSSHASHLKLLADRPAGHAPPLPPPRMCLRPSPTSSPAAAARSSLAWKLRRMFRSRLETLPPPRTSAAEGLLHPLWPNGLLSRGWR
jgi:hypothetical protein